MKGVIVIEGHVQGLSNVRSLGEFGIPVWVLDKSKCLAQYSKYCTKFVICPDFNSEEFIPFLIELRKENDLKDWLLLPSNDHAVYAISKNKNELLNHFKLITDSISSINLIYDKVMFLELAKSLKIPVPNFQIVTTTIENLQLHYPVLTKGRNGLTFYKALKKKVLLSNNNLELQQNLEKIKKVFSLDDTFTQELIPLNKKNRTVSFTSFSVNGEIKTYWIGQKLREHPLQFGTAVLAESIEDPGLLCYAEILLKELDYTGICEIEFLKDGRDDNYKIIEMNARTWLWVGLAEKCGVNYAKIAYDFTQGNNCEYPRTYAKNIIWHNPITNLYYTVIGLIKKQISFSELLDNKGKTRVNALLQKGDWKPFFAYFILISKFKKIR